VNDYKNGYGGSGVSIFGLSALNGYHSMTLIYNGSDFTLIDQGPATSFFTGKSTFKVESVLDDHLSEYVRSKQRVRIGTKKQYKYPAEMSLYKIYPYPEQK